jgi:hypothetical protein
MTACVVLIAIGANAASARERQAGLSAYEIFSDSAPRPPRSIARQSSGAKTNPSASAQTKPLHTQAPAAGVVGQVPARPAVSMFPPVTPLE